MATKKGASKKGASKKGVTGSTKAPSWDKLKTARGNGTLVPATIAALVDPSAVAGALSTLTSALVASGKAFSASAPAIPLLMDVAADPRAPGRQHVLELVKKMVALGEPETLVMRGIDLGDAKLKRRYGNADARATYDAVRASQPRLLELLSGSDGEVRRAAAALLSVFREDAKKLVPALVERLTSDDGPAAAQLILSATSLARGDGELEARCRDAFGGLVQASGRSLARGAALVALATLDGRIDTKASKDALAAFFLAAGSWARGRAEVQPDDLDEAMLTWLGEGVLGDAGRRAATETAFAALAQLRPARGVLTRGAWADRVLGWYFPMRKGSFRAYVSDPVVPSEVRGDARDALVALSSVANSAAYYRHRGLPDDLRSRRRLLGLAPATVLEDRIGKAKTLRWHLLKEGLHAYSNLDDAKRSTAQAFLQKKYFDDLTAVQWLELWTEVVAGSYGLTTGKGPEPILAAMDAVTAEQLRAWGARYLEEVQHGLDDDLARSLGRYLALAQIRGRKEGDWLPEVYDAIVPTVSGAAEILKWLPPERRRRWVEQRIADARPQVLLVRQTVLEVVAKDLLEVVPEATTLVLDELERPDAARLKTLAAGIAEGFEDFRKRVPAVDKVLRARGWKPE
jgi:hypothetical protein